MHKKCKKHTSKQKQKGQHFYAPKKHLREKKFLQALIAQKHIQANKNKKDNILMCLKTSKRKKAHKQTKKDSIFMRIKTPKRKKVTCLAFCAFCAFYTFF